MLFKILSNPLSRSLPNNSVAPLHHISFLVNLYHSKLPLSNMINLNMPEKIAGIIAQENVPAITANEEGIITRINKAFEKVYGWKKKNLIGKPLVTIIPKDYHTAHDIGFSRFLKTEKPTLLGTPLALPVLLSNGGVVSAEHLIYAEKINDEWFFAALIEPRTNHD